MFVAGNLLSAVAFVLHMLLQAYIWVVIIRALLSWVNPDPWNPIVQTLNRMTDPLLDPIRKKMFRMMGSGVGIDLSPLMAKDHISASIFPPAPRYYTQYAGKRCALPLLADDYGLYWSEQYLLQAFLSLNAEFEILCALYALARRRPDNLRELIPSWRDGAVPGAFWLRRV